jgi:hypothetical protein
MAGYTKLFSSIVTSSIWQEDNATRIVWITMLATADARGVVEGAVPGLAHIARVELDECQRALHKLQQPDPYSRTQDFDGRRIEVVEGGWRILNYVYYREKGRHRDRTDYMREYQRDRRRRKQCKPMLTEVDQSKPIAEAEAYTNTDIDNTIHCEKAPSKTDTPRTPEEIHFESARLIYPGKKRGFRVEFENFKKHHKDWKELLDDEGLEDCVQTLIQRQAYSPGFWPMFQTFCNQSRYEEALP